MTVHNCPNGDAAGKPQPERLLNIKEVAERLNVSSRTVRRMVQHRDLPQPVCLGRRTKRWPSEAISTYLKRLTARSLSNLSGKQ